MPNLDIVAPQAQIRICTEEEAKVVAAVWGTEFIQFHAALCIQIQRQDYLKKWNNGKMDTWQNGCFEKMDDLPVPTTPNHHPPKMDVHPKTFL